MDYQYLFGIFFLAAVIIGVFLGVILVSEKNMDKSRKLLAILISVMVLVLFDAFFHSSKLYRIFPHALFIFVSLWLAFPALLFLYTQFYTKQKNKVHIFDTLHFVPFLIDIYRNFRYYFFPADLKIEIGDFAYDHSSEPGLFSIFFFGQSFLYLFLLKWNDKKANPLRQGWLQSIWKIWMAVVIFDGSLSLYTLATGMNVSFYKGLSIFLYAFLVFYIAYQLLKKPLLFFSKPNPALGKYNSTSISLGKLESLADEAKELMETEKLFLKTDLRQKDIAQKLGINSVVLSQMLNTFFQKNFNKWVNTYRAEHAATLIEEGYLEKYSVEALAHQSGYGSKASFYRSFKNIKGQTPIEFESIRKKQ